MQPHPSRAVTGAVPSLPAHLSKMAPTPALWALFLCTCSPVASRIPSFTAMERWEKEAMSSSFHPGEERTTRSEPWNAQEFGNHKEEEAAPVAGYGKERGPSFFLDVREGKKPSRTQALKIQLLRGAVSSINRADTEQTALPGVGVEP